MRSNVKHLLFRAGFGTSTLALSPGKPEKNWRDLLAGQALPLHVITREDLDNNAPNDPVMPKDNGQAKAKQNILVLNAAWSRQLSQPETAVREKMTLFWHDHFACRTRNSFLAQQQNNTLRQYALGNFGPLLTAVSKDAAMLQFLNNQQNKKGRPNENFAREVLELFTLGRDHYTEDDIKNAARAFTGWSFNQETGEFFFRKKVHDDGLKTFRGKTAHFTGDDILNIVLEDKQTARFITEKIWRYFVSTDTLDSGIITSLASSFYKNHYSIEKLLHTIYTSDWFYEDRFRGNRIKSPVELVTGILSQTGGTFENPEATIFIQRALGQVLFLPPNVGGWPNGKEWIDSSSLTFRMTLPSVLLKNSPTDFEAKDDGDANNDTNKAGGKKLAMHVDWPMLADRFLKSSAEETLGAIEDHLLAGEAEASNRKLVAGYADRSKQDVEFVKNVFIGFMSLPEYQLS